MAHRVGNWPVIRDEGATVEKHPTGLFTTQYVRKEINEGCARAANANPGWIVHVSGANAM